MQSTPQQHPSRRRFMQQAAGLAGLSAWGSSAPWLFAAADPAPADRDKRRPKVAAVFTEFRYRSHAYNILENFLAPYLFNGKLTDPGVDVASFYADQFPENDMARDVSRKFDIPLFRTIDEALCLGGRSRELAVDAVLLIAEHGDYPTNARGQKMYPRKEFFDQITAVMRRSNRFVPVFNDKHLSYRWDWSKQMYDEARELGVPFMAGSSVPLAERRPPLELPDAAEIEEAVSIHGGGLESYDFHGLEVLQSFIESRRGGETGVSRVELLSGEALQNAAREGRWSPDLAQAAMQAEVQMNAQRQPRGATSPGPVRPDAAPGHAIVLTYQDGLKATVLKVGGDANRWNFACRLRGETRPRATALFNGPWGNRNLFKALSHAIQYLFVQRKEPYPVERTLLVSGILEAAIRSHEQQGRPIATPELEFAYRPIDFRALRETGASWKILTKDTPQPQDFTPGDERLVKD